MNYVPEPGTAATVLKKSQERADATRAEREAQEAQSDSDRKSRYFDALRKAQPAWKLQPAQAPVPPPRLLVEPKPIFTEPAIIRHDRRSDLPAGYASQTITVYANGLLATMSVLGTPPIEIP